MSSSQEVTIELRDKVVEPDAEYRCNDSSDADRCLQRFQAWIGPDKYVQLHRKLVFYFDCQRSGPRCEALADKTLDRVARNFCAHKTPDRERIDSYVMYGARFVLKEEPPPPPPPREIHDLKPPPPHEAELECLEKCLKELSIDDRRLVLQFYRFQGSEKVANHRYMANNLGITENALRVRVYRIREHLRACCNTHLSCWSSSHEWGS